MIDPDLALRIVCNSPLIAYDTETTGLMEKDIPCGHVITHFEHSIYVPVRHQPGGNILDVDEFERLLNDAFMLRTVRGYRTICHFAAFDQWMARKVGIVVGGILEDTQINEGLIHHLAVSFSLENCAIRYGVTPKLGAELYRAIAAKFGGLADRTAMANFWRMPGDDPLVVDYAEGDGTTTLELRQAQQVLLDEYDLRRVWDLECKLIPHLSKLRHRGMKIDMDKAATIAKETDIAIAEALKVFPPGFNVLSPKDLEAFFRAQGQTEFKATEGGRPSFTEKLLEGSEAGQAVLKVRQLRKAQSSFITPLISTHNVNGRVHPLLNQSKGEEGGAIGGRLSCQEPNMQAFPKRNKVIGKLVRPLVVPDFGEISEADFRQQEPRLFTHYSEDENLIKGYTSNPPIDIHDMASAITGRDREVAKRLGLGILTGLGIRGLADRMGWTYDEAKRGHNEFLKDAFPGILQFQKDAKATMIANGFVRTLLGRRCTVDDNQYAYKAVSRIIQGGGADHTKTSLLLACEYCDSEEENIQLLMTIHDSFISQHTDRKYRNELSRILESAAPLLGIMIPIPVEMGTGRNWGEASYPEVKEYVNG